MALKTGYYLRETGSNLRRNFLMTFTAILTVLISLFMLGGVLLLQKLVGNLTRQVQGNVQINVYLRDDITEAQFQALSTKLTQNPELREVKHLTKDDAYEEFKILFKDQPDIVNAVSPEILPASFRLAFVNPDKEIVRATGEELQGQAGVDEVRYAAELANRLFSLTNVVRTLGYAVVTVLLAAAILLIANTIRLAIFARRREIGVMKLVGATNWFIRIPFILEGMIEGMVGGAAAFGAVWAANRFGLGRLRNTLPFLGGFYVDGSQLISIFAITIALGVVVGGLGSAIALRRFLDV